MPIIKSIKFCSLHIDEPEEDEMINKTETLHTPGPWWRTLETAITCHGCNASSSDYDLRAIGIFSERTRELGIATVYGQTPRIAEANAKLIAAAPDLLAALEGLLEYVDRLTTVEATAMTRAGAAIAKARA